MEVTREQLEDLRELVWLEDISSPTVPEYVEHHESIQKILHAIDKLLETPKVDPINATDFYLKRK